jgi:hypothetical protein
MKSELAAPLIIAPGPKRTYSDSGVDLSLIRWFLRLAPAERLKALENHINAHQKLRDGRNLG